MGREWQASFAANGRRLVGRARAAGPREPGRQLDLRRGGVSQTRSSEGARAYVHGLIQRDHRALAEQTGAGLINVGGAFKRIETAEPPSH